MGILVRQSLKGILVTYIGVLLGFFVQFFIVTKYLDPEILGLTKLFYEVSLLCSGLALLGYITGGQRFFPYFKDEDPARHNNGFFFFSLLLPVIGIIIIGTIYLACRIPIQQFLAQNSSLFNRYFYWVLPLMAILTFWQFFETYSNINLRIATPKAVREVLLRFLTLVLYLLYGNGFLNLNGLMLGLILCYGVCLFVTGSYSLSIADHSLKHDWSYISPSLRNNIFKYHSFVVLMAISGNIMSQLDLIMLSSVRGLYAGGIYTIMVYIAAVVDMPTRNITAISVPLLAKAFKDDDNVKVNKLYKEVSVHQSLTSSLILLLIWINIHNIFDIIPNGERYDDAVYAVLFLGLAKVVSGTLNFGQYLISFSKYYYWSLFINIFLTALTICTNLYFIPIFGLNGAALATLITCLINSSYQQYIVQRKIHASPFSPLHFRVILLVASLYIINLLIPSLNSISPFLDMVVRSTVIIGLAIPGTYYLNISEHINNLLRNTLKNIKKQ